MERKIKTISILLGVVYIMIIGNGIYNVASNIYTNFGSNGEYSKKFGQKYHLSIKRNSPDTDFQFPTLKALKGEITDINPSEMSFTLLKEEDHSLLSVSRDILLLITSLILLALFSFIPIITFKIIRSISKSNIFDIQNIIRIRKTGYALLASYAVASVFSIINTLLVKSVVELTNYSIRYELPNVFILLLGLVVLLFAELLKMSIQIKEEQDLTI